jgi:hypothetical protein
MAALFSDDWMVDFGNAWNDEAGLGDALAKIGFGSVIGYGFDGEDQPRGVLVVENGYVTKAAAYGGDKLNWDLRASLGLAGQPGRLGKVVQQAVGHGDAGACLHEREAQVQGR